MASKGYLMVYHEINVEVIFVIGRITSKLGISLYIGGTRQNVSNEVDVRKGNGHRLICSILTIKF